MTSSRRTLSRRFTPLAAAGAVAAGLLLGSLGCEQRVVRTENNWVGSQLDGVEVVQVGGRRQQPEKDGLAGVGDFLFGWMDGEEETGRVRSVDINERMGRTETRQSTGGS